MRAVRGLGPARLAAAGAVIFFTAKGVFWLGLLAWGAVTML